MQEQLSETGKTNIPLIQQCEWDPKLQREGGGLGKESK